MRLIVRSSVDLNVTMAIFVSKCSFPPTMASARKRSLIVVSMYATM